MKFTIQITRWEPWIGDITVEASSKAAAIIMAREKAKAAAATEGRCDFEYDTTQRPKVSIDGVITHVEKD